MLAENVETWTDQWKQQGLDAGPRGRSTHRLIRAKALVFGAEIAEQSRPLLARISDLDSSNELADQDSCSAPTATPGSHKPNSVLTDPESSHDPLSARADPRQRLQAALCPCRHARDRAALKEREHILKSGNE